LNHALRSESLLPNLQIVSLVGMHLVARDQKRSQYVAIDASRSGRIQVDDVDFKLQAQRVKVRANDAHAPLDVTHVSATQVRQGLEINDCRLQARLASLVQQDPAAIAKMIKSNRDGTFTVTFPGAPDRPQSVTRPTQWERSTFSDGGAEWTVVIQKAYRQLINEPFGPTHAAQSVEGLFTGRAEAKFALFDWPACDAKDAQHPRKQDRTLEAFCRQTPVGHLSQFIDRNDQKASTLFRRDVGDVLSEALDHHMIINTVFDESKLAPSLGQNTAYDVDGHRVNLQPRHYYSVLSFDRLRATVTLRNPWAKNVASGTHNFVGDGRVVVPLRQFTQVAQALDIEKTKQT
jgi:hypothetical protein